jgi:hypothetical protein
MHNLLQFWNVIGSIATFIVAISVFESLRLLVGVESFGRSHERQSRDSIKVGSLPHRTFCISMLDLRRRSSVKSGSRVSSSCQHQKDNVTTVQKSTYSIVANSVNRHQIIVMDE